MLEMYQKKQVCVCVCVIECVLECVCLGKAGQKQHVLFVFALRDVYAICHVYCVYAACNRALIAS